jgi:polysaccharide export outer membrane protein
MRSTATRIISALLLFVLASCGGTRRAIYFATDDRTDSAMRTEAMNTDFQTIIQKDDILAINVSSISSIPDDIRAQSQIDPVKIFREGGTQFNVVATPGAGVSNPGFLVDEEGYIDYPVLGKIKVAGLTIRGAKDALAQRFKKYLKEPVVEVRIINYKVVVLGEVNRPGTIIAPNHKITILDAIAAAGDIPITGRKDNVLVIRQEDGRRVEGRVNLNSRATFNSPFFYLRQNDIVVVEPGTVRRQANNTFTQIYLPLISTFVGVASLIVTIIVLSRQAQ